LELADDMDAAWTQFTRLENRLIKYFNYVPPVEDHYSVWSNELSEMLILIGTGIDSFMFAGIDCGYFNDFQTLEQARRKKHDGNPKTYPTIEDYRRIYDG
jgi:hypothetical protein